jgi:hypothetical protein
VTGFFLPNIAFDMIGAALMNFVSPDTACRIFFAVSLVLTLWGLLILNRVAIGRWSSVPIALAVHLRQLRERGALVLSSSHLWHLHDYGMRHWIDNVAARETPVAPRHHVRAGGTARTGGVPCHAACRIFAWAD